MTPPFAVSPEAPVEWALLQARGDETIPFLQGQLSCDVLTLRTGQSLDGLLLSPSGDVITSLECSSHPEGVDIVVRAEVADATLRALGRFLMRTRCELQLVGAGAGAYATVGEQVRRGEPGPLEFAPGVAAHTFGQDFVERHVSFSKGCYTGQELVGRLDSRGGRVPFHLARVTGRDLEHMASVVSRVGPVGDRALQGLTTAVVDDGFSALALVHRTLLDGQSVVVVDDVAIELLHDGARHAR